MDLNFLGKNSGYGGKPFSEPTKEETAEQLRKLTYRKDKITLVAGVVKEINYISTAPNHFIVNSSVGGALFISDTPNVSATQYSKKINGVSRQLYAEMMGIRTLYLMSAVAGEVVVESYYAEFSETSIQPTIETLSAVSPGSPKAELITLVAGVPYVVKATSGWIIAFASGVVAPTYIRNGVTNVWSGDYIGAQPFYNDVSIILFCAAGNTVSIVYV